MDKNNKTCKQKTKMKRFNYSNNLQIIITKYNSITMILK